MRGAVGHLFCKQPKGRVGPKQPLWSCRAARDFPGAAGTLSPLIRFLQLLSEASVEGNVGYTVVPSFHTAAGDIFFLN